MTKYQEKETLLSNSISRVQVWQRPRMLGKERECQRLVVVKEEAKLRGSDGLTDMWSFVWCK
jgi:hypothetical protein